jgi:hypothetical protein
MTPATTSHRQLFRHGHALLYRGQAMPGKLVIINKSWGHGDKAGPGLGNMRSLRQSVIGTAVSRGRRPIAQT